MMKFVTAVAFILSLLSVIIAQSSSHVSPLEITSTSPSCSCSMPRSVKDGFEEDSSPIFKVDAIEERDVGDAHYVYTVMQVKVVFRGCTPNSQYIIVKSPKTVQACGVAFTPGTTYAVTAKLSRSSTPPPGLPASFDVYTATSCGYNKEWQECPYDDKVFLYYSPVRGCPTQ